jgi:hypothetical protein
MSLRGEAVKTHIRIEIAGVIAHQVPFQRGAPRPIPNQVGDLTSCAGPSIGDAPNLSVYLIDDVPVDKPDL